MHFSSKSALALAVISSTLWVAAANAAAIPELFGTGVATNLPSGKPNTYTALGANDAHYTIGVPTKVVSDPLPGTWHLDNSPNRTPGDGAVEAAWVAPIADQSGAGESAGSTFVYSFAPNFAGIYDTSTMVINAQWAAYAGSTVSFNGNPVATHVAGANTLEGFTISGIVDPAWFNNGVNTFTFSVTTPGTVFPPSPNAPNGLLVTFDYTNSSASFAETGLPEPATLSIVAVGAAGLFLRRRK